MNHVLELLRLHYWLSLVELEAFLLMQRKKSIANMTSTKAAPAATTAITWVVVLNHEPPPLDCVLGVCEGVLAGVLGGEEPGTPFRPGFPEYLEQVKNFKEFSSKPCFQHSSCMFKYE